VTTASTIGRDAPTKETPRRMEPIPSDAEVLLPEGTRLVHIGPHKTGTTSLQAALFAARPQLLAQGVRHVGPSRNPAVAVQSVTGRPGAFIHETPPISHWHNLVREVRRADEPRVVLSSEFLAWAKPDAVRRIVDDLDPARVHIAVTLRPLARLMPSQWQQNVQAGTIMSFEHWLDLLLNKPEGRGNSFWTLHRHDELIERWASVVGREKVTVVVADDSDHGVVLRAFERLTGLRDGTLVPEPGGANRSLTRPEAEAWRAFNVAYREESLGKALYARVMRTGTAKVLKTRTPAPSEPRIEMPQWALDRAVEINREVVDHIVATGIRVIGDLDLLTRPQVGREQPADPQVSPQVAGALAKSVLVATGMTERRWSGSFSPIEPIDLAGIPTQEVARMLAGRIRRRAWKRLTGPIARFRT
jgi:hypothetical protein